MHCMHALIFCFACRPHLQAVVAADISKFPSPVFREIAERNIWVYTIRKSECAKKWLHQRRIVICVIVDISDLGAVKSAQLAPSDTPEVVLVSVPVRPTTGAIPAQMDTTMTCPMLPSANRASPPTVGARAATCLANGEHDNATPKEMRFVRLARQALPTM